MFRTIFKGLKGLTAAGLLVSPVLYCQQQTDDTSHGFKKHRIPDPDYTRLLEGNKHYVSQMLAKDPDYFKKLAKGQSPKYLLISCSDSRVPPNELTNTGPGELFIHRNVASLVVPTDFNINSVLQFSIEVLKVRHIVVMGHTQCGGIKASIDGQYHGMIDQWLLPIRAVYEKYNKELDPIKDEGERLKKFTEFTIKEQVLNLCKNQFVQKAWAKGQTLYVHGWMCEIETGKIYDLQVKEEHWKDIRKYFRMDFTQDQRKA